MFRHTSINRSFVAFLLPFTFIWSWAACSLLCGEITARHEKQPTFFAEQEGACCLTGADTDDCPYTTNAAIIEARQIENSPVEESIRVISLNLPEFLFTATAVYPADVHQNSPPRSSIDPPLFLRYRTFRI